MGSPDNFEGDESEPEVKEEENKSSTSTEKKKLFRDTDNKVVAGVCAGISNYFDWNIGFVRLLLAVSILILGFGFWLYIIAWIIIPEAKSTSEKLAMKGKNATVENIEKYLTKFKTDIKSFDTSNVSKSVKKQSNKFNDFLVGTSKKIDQTLQPKKRITDLGNLIFSIIGFALISLGIIALVSLLYSFVSDANTIGINSILEMIQENSDIDIKNFNFIHVAILGLIFSFSLSLIIQGIKMAFYKNKELINKLKPFSIVTRFLIILAFLAIMIISIANETSFSKFSFYNSYDLDYKTIVVKKLDVKSLDQDYKKVKLDIRRSEHKTAWLRISTNGKGIRSVKNQTIKDLYDFKVTDSIIELSPYIYYNNEFYSDKNVDITLYVPDNDSTKIINEFDN